MRKPILTRNLKVKFLGITPVLNDKTGVLNPQQISAFSALLTFKGKPVQKLLKETIEKGQDVSEKIKNILRKSSLKGHASIATTPAICFSYEASKFLDSGLTGMVFASALMASGRRTGTKIEDIVYPTTIFRNKKAREIYREASEKNINFFNWLLSQGIKKDEASKILQYGIYGTGVVQFPVESIISLKREYESEKKWMPEEVGFLIKEIEKELRKLGIDLLYATRLVAPRNTYPYPNIFKDPKETNIVRDLMKEKKQRLPFKIISTNFIVSPGLKRRLAELKREINIATRNKSSLKKRWLELIILRRQISRDYNLSANVKILSSVSWRVWSEKKRHRTCPMVVESVYYCLERAVKIFNRYKYQIRNKKINQKILSDLENVFYIPPNIKKNREFLEKYLERVAESLAVYRRLIGLKIRESDAIFVVPRGLKLDVLQEYNFYNIITGYYPLRICPTAEEEMQKSTLKEAAAIRKILIQKKLKFIADHIVPKCQAVGFCLEEKTCGVIKFLVKRYNNAFHQMMKNDLEEKFQKVLNSLKNKNLKNGFRSKKTFKFSKD